ncbi:MAG TPA: RNA polymerase sigma factor [Thermomicrobiales bacterium]|jgi:RNA polymerase sigma-70 factor (ECF subfamily)
MSEEHERVIVERARRDPAAFAILYDRYFPQIYAYTRHRLGNEQDAEDLVAEIFLNALTAIERFTWRHEVSCAAWLFRIAHNRRANFYRQQARRRTTITFEAANPELTAPSRPDEIVLHDEVVTTLHAQLARLSPRQREIVALRCFGELRNQEIAAVLGLDERTVAAHLSRGLRELQRHFRTATADDEEAKCPPTKHR